MKGKRVIALGFFDGVHLGHGTLLRRVGEVAAELGAIPTAVTFDAHPEQVIVGLPKPLISSPTDRAELMRQYYGIQEVIVAHFDQRMMRMGWEEFVEDFLVREHSAVHLVAGHDFHFGYKGEGNPERLKTKCAQLGIGCDIMPKVEIGGITVSSSYIRGLLSQGEIEQANFFLGHPHTMTDTVAHGKRLGTTLGFPTVNLRFSPGVLAPAHGIYATKVILPGGEVHRAVTNVGTRPTVDNAGQVNVESYLLDFSGDLYGQTLRVEFYHFIRSEERFPDLESLRRAVQGDEKAARAYFQEQKV